MNFNGKKCWLASGWVLVLIFGDLVEVISPSVGFFLQPFVGALSDKYGRTLLASEEFLLRRQCQWIGLLAIQYLQDQKPAFFLPLTSFNQFWLMISLRHFRTAGDPSSLSSVQSPSWALWSSPKVWTWLKACLCESLRSLWAHLGLGQTWMPNNGIVAINFLNICGPWCLQFWPIQYRMKSLSCGGHPSDSIVVSEGRKGRQKKLHNKMTYSAANDDLYDSTLCQIEFGIYWRQLQDRSQYSHSAWQM